MYEYGRNIIFFKLMYYPSINISFWGFVWCVIFNYYVPNIYKKLQMPNSTMHSNFHICTLPNFIIQNIHQVHLLNVLLHPNNIPNPSTLTKIINQFKNPTTNLFPSSEKQPNLMHIHHINIINQVWNSQDHNIKICGKRSVTVHDSLNKY